MKSNGFLCLVILVLLVISCVPESKKTLTEVEVNVSNPLFQSLIDYQYSEQTDSLIEFFSHEDPTFRYSAAKAFASHQDPKALTTLYQLLDDPSMKVRTMAAYAIGQIAEAESIENIIQGFRQRDTMSIDNSSNAEILSALGKMGDEKLADYMISAEGYRSTDTLLHLGRMKAFFQFAKRNIHNPKMTKLAVETIRNSAMAQPTRLMAAHYLARPRGLDIDKVKFQIAESFVEESDVNIKMALAIALRNTDDPEIQTTLLDQLDLDQDYRIRCNILRALTSYNYINSAEKIIGLLRDDNIHVARAAAIYLAEKGSKDDVSIYRNIAFDSIDWHVKTEIYNSIFKILPYYYSKTINATRWQVQQIIRDETDPLIISHYINTLGNDPGSYEYLIKYGKDKTDLSIKTAIATALAQMLSSDNFNGMHQGFIKYHRRKIFEYLQTEMLSGDEAITAIVGDAIANEKSKLVELIDSTNFLFEAKAKLKVPGQIESIHSLERAIAMTRGVNTPNLTKVESTKSTNWSLLEKYNSQTKVIVKTDKGVFTVELYLDESPGSVLNFLELSENNFYDGKTFHRVVPNFVIQAGSPRGDSYGGMDYVIRSDLGPLSYIDEGYLGMASAGNDTESTQWFITHSPTPHLDGGYSIFGKVIEGMDVIHKIQVGDKILDIITTN